MKTESFKKLLGSYYDYLNSAQQLKGEINLIIYDMENVKAIQYDKEPSSFNAQFAQERMLDLIEKKAEKELELEYTTTAIRLIELKLSKMDEEDKELCLNILNKKITYEEAGKKKGYSKNGMWNVVKNKLEDVL